MFSTRRRVAPIGEKKAINGLYVHSSPPRVLNVNSAHIRHLIRTGDLEKLEQLVLDGQGRKLLGEYSADYKTRTFLKSVPALMAKVNLLHDAVSGGSLEELQNLLQEDCSKRKKMVLCKDQSGVGLLHKAIYYDLSDIAKWLIENYPQTASVKDAEGRTPAHYIAMCKDPREMQRLLTVAGADLYATDSHGRNYKYYMENPGELELPSSHKLSLINGTSKSATSKDSLVIKPSNIRIWIHQRDLGRLQKVLWEGHGSKLRTETSNNSRVKRFLEAVPHLMGAIKEIHTAAVNKDLQLIRDRTSEPVPPVILSSKDANGLNPLHKAAGLGHMDIAKFILEKFPKMANAGDAEGRTPLHYAAILKDGDEMYNMLIGAGAEESSLDNRQKTAAYYKTRPNEIDSRLLQVIPDAPRTATTTFPSSWDWNLLTATTPDESAKSKKSDKLFGSTPTADKNIAEEIKSENSPQEEHAPAEENGKDAQENPEEKHEVHENGHGGNEKDEPEVKEKEEIKENGTHEKNDEEEEEKQDKKEKETDHEDIKKSGNEDVKENGNEDPKENKNNDPKENENEEPKENENEKSKENENEKSKENVNEKSKENGIEHHEENNEVLSKQNEHNDTQDSTDKHVENTEEEHKPEETHHKDSEDNLKKEDDEKTEPKTNGEHHEVDEADDVVTESKDREHKEEHDHEKKPDTPDSQKVGVIEGVVNGENEVETLNNDENNEEANGNHDDDAEVTEMVESGNMEQLAALVLNGEGERLIGKHSPNPETQAFLENVPIYMSKINRVHIAARDGSLRDLQAALDRRKFAIAKDQISPNGASPLHVATIFGNTSIVRYLAGRFPETVQTEDDNGRTPLHYAATLADNGHYYNLLLHLGANASHQDKFGHDAEYYQTNQEDFSHRQLLHDFGAKEELVEEMLNDKVPNDTVTARRNLDDTDMITILDRCFKLLQGRRDSHTVSAASQSSNNNTRVTLLGKYLRRSIYEQFKLRLTRLDHCFYDVIWPCVKKLPDDLSLKVSLDEDLPHGIIAPDRYTYAVFIEFFEPLLKDIHCINMNMPIISSPAPVYVPDPNEDLDQIDIDFSLDTHGKWILSSTLDSCRNLEDYEFPKMLNVGQLEAVERKLTSELLKPTIAKILHPNLSEDQLNEIGSGTYYTMNEILDEPSEVRANLAAAGLLIPLWNIGESDRLHGRHWPYGRGVFVSSQGDVAAWINVLDHLRIITTSPPDKPGNIGYIYSKTCRILFELEKKLRFRRDEKFGNLSARPTCLGNTLQFSMNIKFPNLVREPGNLKHLCTVRGLTCKPVHQSADIFRIGNQQCLGVTEIQTFEDFVTAVSNIMQLEKDLAMHNSLHIAQLFVNVFRRRRSNLIN